MNEFRKVRTGLDEWSSSGFKPLRGLRVGVVANAATVDCKLTSIVSLLIENGIDVRTVFGPEHGFHGIEQDLVGVPDEAIIDGRRVVSLYGSNVGSLTPSREQLAGLECLVVDLPDVGSRYYTFQATMLKCLEAASEHGLRVLILDRPNPLGGEIIEGPGIIAGYESFVGAHSIPIRNGLTLGELARLYHAERKLACSLDVVPCTGWRRIMTFDETGLPWTPPSPNMPTLDTARVYPGQCLMEGTNLSEGRGTTRPFEICGAPWINAMRLAERLAAAHVPGAIFRPVRFRPTFQKFAGQVCEGVQIHIADQRVFQPVRASLTLLHAMRAQALEPFRWRTETYEFVSDKLAIDLLFGSDRERRLLENGATPAAIAANWVAEEEAFRERRKPYLLYD